MYKLHSFTIYIQTLTLIVLATLFTLTLSGRELHCVLIKCLWLCHLGTGYPGPYSLELYFPNQSPPQKRLLYLATYW